MDRDALEKLVEWKTKKSSKPLIIKGARQVGKTWLMKEFGQLYFEQTIYINFEQNNRMKLLFEGDFNIKRIIEGIEIYIGYKIDAEKSLLIFDEIQEVPRALNSLKYFNEDAPEYRIICAGSLLGVTLHQESAFPVGKVEFLDLYPLSFLEFLNAYGFNQFKLLLTNGDYEMANVFNQDYINLLKQYFIVGGLPEVVVNFVENQNYNEVREIQNRILRSYEQDFSKHAPNDIVPRIRMMWNSIPSQLAKENKKYIYGLIKQGSRAKDFELALMWLIDSGLVHKISRVNTINLPLKAYEDLKAFKLYILDVGLLSCMVNLDPDVILDSNNLFVEFKGSLSEQYVLQQLIGKKNIDIFYWSSDTGSAEVDFVLDTGKSIIPLEVKAEQNLKSKSLRMYYEKFNPALSVRTSMTNYKKEDWLLNLPLWSIEKII